MLLMLMDQAQPGTGAGACHAEIGDSHAQKG
jgi:hypothetical protein